MHSAIIDNVARGMFERVTAARDMLSTATSCLRSSVKIQWTKGHNVVYVVWDILPLSRLLAFHSFISSHVCEMHNCIAARDSSKKHTARNIQERHTSMRRDSWVLAAAMWLRRSKERELLIHWWSWWLVVVVMDVRDVSCDVCSVGDESQNT
jgi:hypothetical protein